MGTDWTGNADLVELVRDPVYGGHVVVWRSGTGDRRAEIVRSGCDTRPVGSRSLARGGDALAARGRISARSISSPPSFIPDGWNCEGNVGPDRRRRHDRSREGGRDLRLVGRQHRARRRYAGLRLRRCRGDAVERTRGRQMRGHQRAVRRLSPAPQVFPPATSTDFG